MKTKHERLLALTPDEIRALWKPIAGHLIIERHGDTILALAGREACENLARHLGYGYAQWSEDDNSWIYVAAEVPEAVECIEADYDHVTSLATYAEMHGAYGVWGAYF